MDEKGKKMKWKLAIVILNYEAYHETERCVDSILSKKMKFEGLVIVDNSSRNESVAYLRRKYRNNDKIKIIVSHQNCGFAKGNNIGIKAAKQSWNIDFVLLLNSDTIMLQEDYIGRMMRQYQKGIAVIQSNALRTNKRYTSETYTSFSLKDILSELIERICDTYNLYNFLHVRRQGSLGPIISGCDFLLTPDYFQVFQGLYPLTFLFLEEDILMIMLKKSGLHSSIARDAFLLHKESMSTPNDLKIGNTRRNKILIKGYFHMLLVRIMPLWMLKKIVNCGEW